MVIRKVEECDPPGALPEVDAWVIESDRRQALDDIPATPEVDLQVDFSPYIVGGDAQSLDHDAMKAQAEVFIGYKEKASSWTEKENPDIPADRQPGRVDLNLLNSSNQLFADYQPHNSNVFSMIDTLSYLDQGGNRKVAVSANVSYSVLGWHALQSKDPFGNLNPDGPKPVTRGARLGALNMSLDQADPATKDGIAKWLASTDPTRVLCHGAMYNVLWDAGKKPPNVPADVFFEKLSKDMPVSVGTTPMDALLTYISSHASPNDPDDGNDVKEVERDLLRIQKLLHARDDGVDAQEEAADIVYNWNYASSSGGSHFFLAGSDTAQGGGGGQPTKPSADSIAKLAAANGTQRYLDGLARQLQLLRSDMFAFWWQYMTALQPPDPVKTRDAVRTKTQAINDLLGQIKTMTARVEAQKAAIPEGLAQTGVLPPFYAARDPTMLVAGVESGWPWDFLQSLRARVDTQLLGPGAPAPQPDADWSRFLTTVLPKLPDGLADPAARLVLEFLALNPANPAPPEPKDGYRLPLYHDLDRGHLLPDGTQPWRDRWEKSQAWFPLFLEWVAEYTHIPFPGEGGKEYWELDQQNAWHSEPKKLRYGIAPGAELADLDIQDKRTVSGRVLILPQPSLNLQMIVGQILDNLPDGYLTPDQAQELRDHLHELAFLSSPLSGFTNHLTTRVQGNHIKPTLRVPDADEGTAASSDVVPFKAAVDVGSEVGFQDDQLYMMGLETDLVPYGTLVPYLDPRHSPFKPVTHGQFRFTALNIIDKFGQAIPAIDPTPTRDQTGPPPLYPCISEYYTPQPSGRDPAKANTVVPDDQDLCQYVQLPPSINQPARLNSAFVDYFVADPATGAPAGWRPLDEWSDDFVWGWVVPNYADSGIQLFLPDGTFFREIRLGGPHGTTESGSFLPFTSPPVSTDPNTRQLELFAQQLADRDYIQSFMAMLNASLGTAPPPPTAYAEFLSSVIGKPLALAKAAFSLELATAPLTNQSTINAAGPDCPLPDYRFGVQLGDASRVYDGLVGYFAPSATPAPGNCLDLGTIFTHFVPDPPSLSSNSSSSSSSAPNLAKIAPANYPTLQPFWLDPLAAGVAGAADPPTAYAQQWNAQLRAVGVVIDPFVPVHAYTGVLPARPAQLPPWTWQRALRRMTAFFHAGPLLATADVPAFQPGYRLRQDYNLADPAQVLPGSGVGVPALQAGKWAWLQPYSVGTTAAAAAAAAVAATGQAGQEGMDAEAQGSNSQTAFMALDMAVVDERPRFEAPPYTAVEGYMQLRQSIEQAVTPS